MILLIVAATLGLGLVVAWRSATARRWLRYAVGAWLLLWAWLILGHYLPPIGYLGYTFPFVVAAFLFRHRLARRFPVLARLMERFPHRAKKRFEHAFKDEIGDDGKPSVPKVTKWERFDA